MVIEEILDAIMKALVPLRQEAALLASRKAFHASKETPNCHREGASCN